MPVRCSGVAGDRPASGRRPRGSAGARHPGLGRRPPSARPGASPRRWPTPCSHTWPRACGPASTWSSSTPATTSPRRSAPATPSRRRCRSRCAASRPRQTVAEQDAEFGAELFERDPDRCCALRKVAPLAGALASYQAWASGLRRDEAPTRANAGVVEWDASRSMVKLNPIAAWTAGRRRRVHRGTRRSGQPAAVRRLRLGRLRAVHPAHRRRGGRTVRTLGGHLEDRVRPARLSRRLRTAGRPARAETPASLSRLSSCPSAAPSTWSPPTSGGCRPGPFPERSSPSRPTVAGFDAHPASRSRSCWARAEQVSSAFATPT